MISNLKILICIGILILFYLLFSFKKLNEHYFFYESSVPVLHRTETPSTLGMEPFSTNGACKDIQGAICHIWKAFGECDGAAKDFTRAKCAKSCGVCSTGGGGGGGGGPPPVAQTPEEGIAAAPVVAGVAETSAQTPPSVPSSVLEPPGEWKPVWTPISSTPVATPVVAGSPEPSEPAVEETSGQTPPSVPSSVLEPPGEWKPVWTPISSAPVATPVLAGSPEPNLEEIRGLTPAPLVQTPETVGRRIPPEQIPEKGREPQSGRIQPQIGSTPEALAQQKKDSQNAKLATNEFIAKMEEKAIEEKKVTSGKVIYNNKHCKFLKSRTGRRVC